MQKMQLKGIFALTLRADEDAYFGLKAIAGYKLPNDAYWSIPAGLPIRGADIPKTGSL